MKVLASSPTARFIRDRGGLVFVMIRRYGVGRGSLRLPEATTELPKDALSYRRYEAGGFLVFTPPGVPPPEELEVEVKGHRSPRLRAYWNGCAYIV